MIDQVKLTLQGGHGGSGAISFLHRPGIVKIPPDGGDGGSGGNVYILASADRNTLLDFRFRKIFQAESGNKGGIKNQTGKDGSDLILKVPVGTEVRWLGHQIADLTSPGQQILIARGGRGGRGNTKLKTKFDRRPHHAEPGEEGEQKEIELELKLLADIGLVGLPNAGKSTLLSRLTSAQPKIGAYPFTTLEPNLGVMAWKGKTAVIADIPGLIEGAAEGRGLGHDFLRHINRTKLLIHLTDSWLSYQLIEDELEKYSQTLTGKHQLVVLSQADRYSPEELKEKLADLRRHRLKPMTISAATGEGLASLKDKIIEALPD